MRRARSRSSARSDTATGDMPGGAARHFCVHEYAKSTPQAPTSSGTPASEVTQSAIRSVSRLAQRRAELGAAGARRRWRSRRARRPPCARLGWRSSCLHRARRSRRTPPSRRRPPPPRRRDARAISEMRRPKKPHCADDHGVAGLEQIRDARLHPGRAGAVQRQHQSRPACGRRAAASRRRRAGCRAGRGRGGRASGVRIASSTAGSTFVGPGPHRSRSGGWSWGRSMYAQGAATAP